MRDVVVRNEGVIDRVSMAPAGSGARFAAPGPMNLPPAHVARARTVAGQA